MQGMIFSGRSALVTGGAGGMGSACARALRGAGVSVVTVDTQPLAAAGHEADPHVGAVADADVLGAAVALAEARHGPVDYLVNAAGVLWFDRDRSALDVDMAVWRRVLDVNLGAMALAAREVAPGMRRRGFGAMVHVSSTQALRGDDRPQDAYQVSKAGVIALSKSLAVQLAPHGVRSNALVPGPTRTPMQARWDRDETLLAGTAATVPLGRVGTPEDMAGAVAFLLSDHALYITGTELVVDGGLTARP